MEIGKTPDSIPKKNEFTFSDPRQRAIYEYLKRLVSGGAASFYKDACRHMAARPPFETVTHIVGHLLRELTSSFMGVLEGISESIPKDEDNRNERQIKIILAALGISEDDPAALAWFEVQSFHKGAHRSGLDPARPMDDDFKDKWDKFNLVLLTVLGRFETRYIKVFENIQKLAAIEKPTKDDIKTLKEKTPNNRAAHERFFSLVTSPKWLPMLESAGFFKHPPAPEEDVDGGVRHLTWPILGYLSRVAQSLPDPVTKILSEIPDTENGNVKAGMIDAAMKLPKEKRVELVPHIKRWMTSGGQFFSSMKTIAFIKSLIKDKETEAAFTLSRELLEFAPTSVEHAGRYSFRDPKIIIDPRQYEMFLDEDFPVLAEQDPLNALDLLCELLSKYNDLDHGDQKEDPPQDYSYIKRPSIEKPERLGREAADDSLLDAILDVSIQTIDAEPKLFAAIIEKLYKQKWRVFDRVALYLLSKYPNIVPELTVAALMNPKFWDNSSFEREYAMLADSSFDLLNPEQKQAIYDFIDKADGRKNRLQKKNNDITDVQLEYLMKTWQRDKLSMFSSHLDGEMKDRYEKLVADLGKASNPITRKREGVSVGPISHVSADKLAEMSDDEIVDLLKTWEPEKGGHGFGSSKEGLGRELSIATKRNVARFSSFAIRMIGLDPTYVRSYLQSFPEVIQNHVPFEWPQIIDLCLWVIEQQRDIDGRTETDGWADEDPHWGWTRRAVISMISNGLNNNVIPFDLNEKVWHIIEVLSSDPNPTPEEEMTKEGALKDDAYSLTINTVRGEAMTAVVEYGLWMTRQVEKIPEDERPQLKNFFSIFTNVRDVLEKGLSDPSIAVRAVYGRYFPWILLLDRDWTLSRVTDIFPKGGFGTSLYDAAWETYISHVSPYDDVFDVLHDQYAEAVKNLGTRSNKKENSPDSDTSLIDHLMVLFWRGKLDPKDSNGLLATFWKTADEEARSHAIDFLGRSLHSLTDPLAAKEAKLLTELWEMRIKEAEAADDKMPYEKEMGAFGWWFESGKLDEIWSVQEFMRSLNLSNKVDADYFVIDRLVLLAETKPLEAIQILEKLVKPDRQQWLLLSNEGDLRSIFTKVLRSSNPEAKKAAEDLINRLAAWGYTVYSDLLLNPIPTSSEE